MKLPGQRPELPANVISIYIVPLDLTYPAIGGRGHVLAICIYSDIRESLIMSRMFSLKTSLGPCLLILPISKRYM